MKTNEKRMSDEAARPWWIRWLTVHSWRSYLVGVLLMASIATNGIEHGHLYSRARQADSEHRLFRALGIHAVDVVQEGAYYALAFLAAPNPLAVVGAGMAARPLFQMPINVAAGKPLHWAPERFEVRVGQRVLYDRPVAGPVLRAVQPVLGLLLYLFHARVGRLLARAARRLWGREPAP